MKLNKGHWDLWKQSEKGKGVIQLFEEIQVQDLLDIEELQVQILFDKYIHADHFDSSDATDFVNDLRNFGATRDISEDFSDYKSEMFFDWILNGNIVIADGEGEFEFNNPSELLARIPEISTWLYLLCPDFYKPYLFYNEFHLLTRIADTFGIELPTIPLKRYKSERFKYYWHLCNEFSRFQEENDMTASEFCAFLYDFAPNDLKQNEPKILKALPEPTQVWMVGGDKAGTDFEFLDNFAEGATHFWQGNIDTRKGDLLVMYCLAPRSYIHSIWRATTDGIADPFFHWYGSVYIGEGQKVTPITHNELKSDSYFSQHPLVRKNLQGVNGYLFTSEDYLQLQKMIVDKGGEISHLPKLYGYQFDKNKSLNDEEEVNVHLVEPLFINLGYTRYDWVKERPVSMGRGESKYADYAFPAKGDKNSENVSMLVESKKHIKTKRDMDDAFRQVKSYGKRLLAKILVIADKDSIWIYQRQKDYDFDSTQYIKKAWKELEDPDNFNSIRRLIGK